MKNRNFVIALLYPMLMAVLAMGCGTSSAEPVSSNIPVTATSVVVAKTTSLPLEELIEEGDYQYESGCSGCHGADARGLPNIGKDLVESSFVKTTSDSDLSDFIKVGRGAGDKDNSTGVDMPPKGGNPALSDSDIEAIIAFLRSLQD